ncbi:MAG: pilus assembly FimT family protein [Peptostreptococcaceae bacterium]
MTLVELVVTIGILAVIVTLCFPKDNISKYQVNSFIKQLCSDIRYVRKCNMNGNTGVYIYYGDDEDNQSYILRENGKNIKEIVLPKEAKLNYVYPKIIFKSDGSPDPLGTTITVWFKGNKKEITIVPISGRVLIKEDIYEA